MMNNFKKSLYVLALPLLSLLHVNPVSAQEVYPAGPIELIVPWGPGGGADIMGRMTAKWLESDLKNTFTVLNVAGGDGANSVTKKNLKGG